ncbi:hypothetical protein PTSG_02714 [Salpingoeca rosetta]|uniref:Carbamoyl phosphate synthase ATP-binding domain-containing protein n=1 Tax=Salpingoeca rosetta (strain ATCC 50818 / BSB-021) TaxID=946362 RepID=F2U334_SALR5|nr:uncharacterized protein PTSG_02714 [Salpingoeca rosetta]EGD82028.1 hypothetical protein PTSG_02714 [Salpingoeca rosetta]|eukprot:XP_004996211.1 hypothetical protein PTSG_02714 [Salpingoeca rosetta]
MLCTVKAPIAAYLTFDDVVCIAKEQKVVEIAPAPHLPSDIWCCGACMHCFGVDKRNRTCPNTHTNHPTCAMWCSHYFKEVNLRIQVAEMVTGVDLVQSQLMLAGGATLIQVRITTKDPLNDFAPDTGAHALACVHSPSRELEPYTTAAPPPAHGDEKDEGEVDEAALGPFDVLVHHTGMLELVRALLGKQQGVISITPLDEHQGQVARVSCATRDVGERVLREVTNFPIGQVQLTARRDPDCPAWTADELWSVWVEPVSEGIEEVLPSLAKANGGFHSHTYKPHGNRVRGTFRFVSRESAELMVRLYDQREVLGTKLNVFPDPKAKN